MHSTHKPSNQPLDAHLWHACAGGLAHIPPLNSKVYYFPQGHIENSPKKDVDFRNFPKIPPIIPCHVSSVNYSADADTDEVYAKIVLIPSKTNGFDPPHDHSFDAERDDNNNPNSFAKTLTQSDANNGGGFSVPRYCAETLFPRLDYSAEPPVQTILVRDVHGEVWKFRHIYRGTPRRHLLTTGWSNFVTRKRLVAGDSVVFLRAHDGGLRVGIRRAKLEIWGSSVGRAVEGVIESMSLACVGRPFEVVYRPRSGGAEFVVCASAVGSSMSVRWCQGMRFKMAFETEDSSRVSWFMGTVSSVRVDDPARWPNSPWKLLQVIWDEPDLLKNVKRVNPWAVELVPSDAPPTHLAPFHLPIKRPRVPQANELLNNIGRCPILTFPTNVVPPLSPISPLCGSPEGKVSNSIQGSRHVIQMGLLSSNLRPDEAQSGPGLFEFGPVDCICGPNNKRALVGEEEDGDREPTLFLFGCPILTEKQILQGRCSGRLSGSNLEGPGNVSGSSVSRDEASSEALPLITS